MLLFLKDKKVYETVLEYRGSINGWEAKDFHDWADVKDWTVSLFKILDGDCVGGFTTDSWHGRGDMGDIFNCCVRDDNAFLFNLSCARKFPSQHSGKDIVCGSCYGPAFGVVGGWELTVFEPFNGDS